MPTEFFSMNQTQLDRLLRLVNRTHDKLVILDKPTDSGAVLMPLDQYEDLIEPTFDDFDWDDPISPVTPLAPFETTSEQNDKSDAEDIARIITDTKPEIIVPKKNVDEPVVVPIDPTKIVGDSGATPNWNQANIAPASESEDISDIPHDEEEEKFYLEPVE